MTAPLGLAAEHLLGNPANAAENQASACTPNPNRRQYKELSSILKGFEFVEPLMRGRVLWGYRPIEKFDFGHLPPKYAALALSGLQLLNNRGHMEITNQLSHEATCDGIQQLIRRNHWVQPGHERGASERLIRFVRNHNRNRSIRDLPYLDRVKLVANILLNSFRDIKYNSSEDFWGAPQTIPQLLANNKGDCKDFACARVLLALALNIRPEHVALAIYASPNRDEPGHANVMLYLPHRQEWFIIDGVGAGPNERLGQTLALENDQRFKEEFADDYLGRAALCCVVTRHGICGTNAIIGSIDGSYQLRPPEPMIVKTREPLIVIQPAVLFEEAQRQSSGLAGPASHLAPS